MGKNEYPKALALYTQIAEQDDLSDETYDDAIIASLKIGRVYVKDG